METVEQSNSLDYYKVGSRDNIVISNSSLSKINPEQGGSPKKFLAFFDEKEEEAESQRLTEGRLVHRYQENPDKFAVSEIEKPSAMMGLLSDALHINIDAVKTLPSAFADITTEITSTAKKEATISADILAIRDAYDKLASLLQVSRDEAILSVRKARMSGNYYSSYGEAVVVNRIITEAVPYLKEMSTNKGKVILPLKTKEAVDGAITSLHGNKQVCELIHLDNTFGLDDLQDQVFSEVPVYWQEKVSVLGSESFDIRLNCKGLMDKVVLNLEKKTIKLVDLKTTAYPIALFNDSFGKWRYYRQMAFYVKALSQWFKAMYPTLNLQDFKLSIYIIAVETSGFFESQVFEVPYTWIFKGKEEYQNLLRRIAWHKYNNQYEVSYEAATSPTGIITLANPTS